MKIIKEFMENQSLSGEVAVIGTLSPEIMNFRPSFKGSLQNTFIVSHLASSNFGFDVINGEPIIGVPENIFGKLIKLRVLCVKTVKGRSGIYILFQANKKGVGKSTMAIKLEMRSERVRICVQKRSVRFVSMKNDFSFEQPSRSNSFDLAVHEIDKIDWE